MRSILIFLAFTLLSSSLYSLKPSKGDYSSPSTLDVRVIRVSPAPEQHSVTLKTIFPRPYENKRKNPINLQLRLKGFVLGALSQDERSSEIYNHKEGQSLHVLIDNFPYFSCSQTVQNASCKSGDDFCSAIVSFLIPFSLKSGQHVIRCFPAHSYGESLKKEGCFRAQTFYFQDRLKKDTFNFDPKRPYLTYNEPQGIYPASKSKPILLDFYLTNCNLSEKGYKVRFSINNEVVSTLTEWTPYYVYGLKKGTYLFKLELLDSNHQLVSGCFNYSERDVIIQ